VPQENKNFGTVRYTYVSSPLGDILIAGNDHGIRAIALPIGSEKPKPEPDWFRDPKPFREATRQLAQYFAGTRRAFDLSLTTQGTAFQKTVWRALRDIPYGETVSYFELACRIGRPSASRAVAAANADNPFPIVVPCHRVVGNTSALKGYSGSVRWKEDLRRLESATSPDPDGDPDS